MPALSQADVVMRKALAIAEEMLAGSASPRGGAARIWALVSENHGACFEQLREFIAAASQYDEVPDQRDALAGDAMRAARTLVSRQR